MSLNWISLKEKKKNGNVSSEAECHGSTERNKNPLKKKKHFSLILKEIYSNVGYLKTKIPKKEK